MESTTNHRRQATEVQILSAQKQNAQSYQIEVDRSNLNNWLRIYPKGRFMINKDAFMGSADSLVWYVNNQQVKTQQQWKAESKDQLHQKVSKHNESQAIQKRKTQVAKTGMATWWIWAGVAAVVIFFCYRKVRFS